MSNYRSCQAGYWFRISSLKALLNPFKEVTTGITTISQCEERDHHWGFHGAGKLRAFQLLLLYEEPKHVHEASTTEEGPVWTPHS